MAENIDDITVDYEEDGVKVVKQIDKKILSRGGWTTIVFLFQDFDKNAGDYGPKKASIRRYQKRGGYFRQQSKFNVSSAKQAMALCSVLNEWFGESSDTQPAETAESDEE